MQCADNPGINAYHVEGRGWVLSGDELNVVEFRGQHANIRYCTFTDKSKHALFCLGVTEEYTRQRIRPPR